MDRRPVIRFLVPALTAAVALAGGACERGEKGRTAEGAASDTAAFRAAVGQADTNARMTALEGFLATYSQSSFRPSAYRRLYQLKKARNPEDASTFLRRQLESEKQADARGTLYFSLFEHAREHQPAEALAVARAVLADPAPLPAEIYNAISWDLAESGENLETALELADVAVAKAPDRQSKASCLDTQGWVYFRKGDYAKAVELLEAARATAPEPIEEVDIHLAKAYQAAGKREEAKALYLRLLLTQENPEMREAVAELTRELGGSPAQVFRDLDRQREERAKPAPDLALKDYSGKEVRLSDFKGSVVLLNFWHPT